ncbi:MAG: quinolinate synthase NadA [Lachnospiraceae bacterium]|nr:quinolinate synthase NadA [Lachnospiraceae bacterium]
MNVADLQAEVLRLKKEKDVCILAHSYVAREIAEVADFVGDSFQLSVKAKDTPQKTVLMCGVRFMAETVKILSPEKTVILSAADAGCPMAEQLSVEIVEQARKMFPGCAVVAYINTTAELKTVCDVCVTSSSAVKIVSNMPQDKILFIPDQNLGQYVKSQVPNKDIRYMQGGCPVHAAMTREEVLAAKAAHPNALFLVHPECVPAVVELADFVGSTAAIMDFAKKSDAEEFIIGTENSIVEHLQYDCPGKMFYPLSKRLICMNMKLTTLGDVANILRDGRGGEEIVLSDELIEAARRPIDAMLAFG